MQGPFYNGYPQGQPAQMQTVQAQPTDITNAVLKIDTEGVRRVTC